jgi:hypothetical protein
MIGINQDGAVVVLFEGGDIITSSAVHKGTQEGYLGFREAIKHYNIGTKEADLEEEDQKSNSQIFFVFKNTESIDVVIKQLQTVKKIMIEIRDTEEMEG